MDFILVCVAYLLGSIPFGYLLVLGLRRQDIRSQGSGNIGATNVLRSGGKGLGVLTFFLDAGKGYAAVMVAEHVARNRTAASFEDAAILAGLAAIVGHIFPVWLLFRGGKGVATASGVFLAISPWTALAAFAIFTVVVLLTRYVSLASIVAAVALPFLALLLSRPPHSELFRVSLFCCSALVVIKHKGNIVRLLHGVEYRFGKTGTTEA